MSRTIRFTIDGRSVEVSEGTTVAVALVMVQAGRRSVGGDRREAVCGIGNCWECRATVDGVADVRTCLVRASVGMRVETRD